jgi:hypothetical protein
MAPRPPWVLLSRIALVEHDAVEDPMDISVELVVPPYFSELTLPTSAHPDPTPDGADQCPYVIAAANDSDLVLLHVSRAPSIGFYLNSNPKGVLVVARCFLPGSPTGTAVRVPGRDTLLQHRVSTVRSVGLLPIPGTGGAEYVVAELIVADRSSLFTFRPGSDFWEEHQMICPLVTKSWSPYDVVAHDGKLWWADLTQGLLVCNLLDHTPELRYVELPELFPLDDRAERRKEIKWYRFVGVSSGGLRFVDVARKRDEPPEKTAVVVWTLVSDPFDIKDNVSDKPRWQVHARTSLAKIWASDIYKARRMPEEVPVLAFVHPHKPDVVYFFLNSECFFSVDVRNSDVMAFVRGNHGTSSVNYWHHCLPWVLPPSRPSGIFCLACSVL